MLVTARFMWSLWRVRYRAPAGGGAQQEPNIAAQSENGATACHSPSSHTRDILRTDRQSIREDLQQKHFWWSTPHTQKRHRGIVRAHTRAPRSSSAACALNDANWHQCDCHQDKL
jgi:hypothetical protein